MHIERVRQDVAHGFDAARGHHEQAGAAVLPQELPTAAAGHDDDARTPHAEEVGQSPASRRREVRDDTALGAQRHAVGSVLHVAAGQQAPVVRPGRGPHRIPRVGRVGPRLDGERRLAQFLPDRIIGHRDLLLVGDVLGRGRTYPAHEAGDREDRDQVRQHEQELGRHRRTDGGQQVPEVLREAEEQGCSERTVRVPLAEDHRGQCDEALPGGHLLAERETGAHREGSTTESGDRASEDGVDDAGPVHLDAHGVRGLRVLAHGPHAQAPPGAEHEDVQQD